MRDRLTYSLLLVVKAFSRAFYKCQLTWIGRIPKDPWADLRLVVVLNHTSLYEPLFAGGLPNRFLKRIATHGLLPVADKTFCRPMVGRFFRMIARNVVPITRLKDHTWSMFFSHIRPESLVILFPEGRMKRRTGFDSDGKPMTVRGGVADIIQSIPGGRMLIAYSQGLHHIQAPSQLIPKLFKSLQIRVENLDVRGYCQSILQHCGEAEFKNAVIRDLESRRDRYCMT